MATRDHKTNGEIDHLHGLYLAKFTMGNLYKWGKDVYEKNRDFDQDACKLLVSGCKSAEDAFENLKAAVDFAENTCNMMPRVVLGSSNPVYLACVAKFSLKSAGLRIKMTAKNTACHAKEAAKCAVLSPSKRYIQWAVLYGFGEALKAMDAVILHINLPSRTVDEEFEFTEATYENVLTIHEW